MQGGSPTRGAPWSVLILPYLDQQALYGQFNMEQAFNIDFNAVAPMNDNFEPSKTVLHVYQCPSDPAVDPESHQNRYHDGNTSYTNYVGVQGGGLIPDCSTPGNIGIPLAQRLERAFYLNGVLYWNSSIRFSAILDGTTNVFMVGETALTGQDMTFASSFNTSTVNGSVFCLGGALDGINSISGQPYAAVSRSFSSFHEGGSHFTMADGSVHFVSEHIDLGVYRQTAVRSDRQPVGQHF